MEEKRENRGRNVGRYFVNALPGDGEEITLRGAEARHAGSSRRARPGDTVTLFDGSGLDVAAQVVEATKGALVLRAVSRRHVGPPLALPVTCACALPKGSREDTLVSLVAQTGIGRLVPVAFERSVVRPDVHWEKRCERLRRLAVEAAKQSGASTVMEIGEPVTLGDFLLSVGSGLALVGAPREGGGLIGTMLDRWPFERLTFLVGPEGGLTGAESAEVEGAGFIPVRLGPTVLRIETACIAFAATAAAFISEHG
ncbi:MAG: RsmE family RNA methyltransferase [Planctomycetota bacterium]|jgi:16S rRNA (uracil1498-N3)-methyltransferase